jgi:hypothetical protein
VVVDVQPVAHLLGRPVDRQRQILQRVGDEEGDHLFRVLAGANGVAAAGRDHVDAVGDVVGAAHQLAAGLGGRVGRAGQERVVLDGGMAGFDVAVHLVGGDLEQPPAMRPRRLEQRHHPHDVGAGERLGIEQRAVDVGLGGEVHHGVALRHERVDRGAVGNVALDEAEPGSARTPSRLAGLPA